MPPIDYAAQTASFTSESFTDGAPSDGAPTEQEAAAAAANQSGEGAAAEGGEGENPDESGQGAEGGEGGEGEGGEGAGGENPDESGQQPDKQPKASGKGGKPSANDRIGDLTAKWRSEERRANGLQAELDALKSGKATLTAQPDPVKGDDAAPDPSQFDYGELDPKYIAALARYHTGKELAAQRAEDDKNRQAAAADAKRQEAAVKADAMLKAGVALHDDFDEVVVQGAREGKWELSEHLGPLLLDSEFGHEIAYELAKNPAESARVAKLSPVDQAKYLGRQEAKFEAAKSSQGKPPPKAPQAPPPPKTPRGSSGPNKVGADSTDFAAVERAYRAGELR